MGDYYSWFEEIKSNLALYSYEYDFWFNNFDHIALNYYEKNDSNICEFSKKICDLSNFLTIETVNDFGPHKSLHSQFSEILTYFSFKKLDIFLKERKFEINSIVLNRCGINHLNLKSFPNLDNIYINLYKNVKNFTLEFNEENRINKIFFENVDIVSMEKIIMEGYKICNDFYIFETSNFYEIDLETFRFIKRIASIRNLNKKVYFYKKSIYYNKIAITIKEFYENYCNCIAGHQLLLEDITNPS